MTLAPYRSANTRTKQQQQQRDIYMVYGLEIARKIVAFRGTMESKHVYYGYRYIHN